MSQANPPPSKRRSDVSPSEIDLRVAPEKGNTNYKYLVHKLFNKIKGK